MFRRKFLGLGLHGLLSAGAILAWQVEAAQAHTVSIGYESTAPGTVTFWYGTYHTGVTYTEGSLQLLGTGYASTVAFTLLTLAKPTGLIDGVTNFYSNGTALVGDFAASAYKTSGVVAAWQGASFAGLHAGTYTFTYIPISSPTSVWQPIDSAILSYTIDLSGALIGGTALSPFAGNANQRAVAGTLDAAIAAGVTNSGLTALGSMSSDGIINALNQASGENTASARQASMQMMNPFLTSMIDPFVTARDPSFGPAMGFAPERAEGFSPEIASAYAAVMPKKAGALADAATRWNVWGSAYGGQSQLGGNLSVGSHDTSVRTAGVATGFDYRVTPSTVVGFALAGGHSSWALSEGLGSGQSDVFQTGIYGSTRSGAAYLSGSLAVGVNSMSTDRLVSIAGLDRLSGSFDALSYGGRVEGGYRFATPAVGVTPYAAVQVQAFHMPSYSETASAGSNNFALNYNSQNSTDTRTEVGAWLDRSFTMDHGNTLVLRGRAAWAHDWLTGADVSSVFQALPTTSFLVNGAKTAPDSALVSAGAELKLLKGLSFGVKFDGEFANSVQTYAGTGTVRYSW